MIVEVTKSGYAFPGPFVSLIFKAGAKNIAGPFQVPSATSAAATAPPQDEPTITLNSLFSFTLSFIYSLCMSTQLKKDCSKADAIHSPEGCENVVLMSDLRKEFD